MILYFLLILSCHYPSVFCGLYCLLMWLFKQHSGMWRNEISFCCAMFVEWSAWSWSVLNLEQALQVHFQSTSVLPFSFKYWICSFVLCQLKRSVPALMFEDVTWSCTMHMDYYGTVNFPETKTEVSHFLFNWLRFLKWNETLKNTKLW